MVAPVLTVHQGALGLEGLERVRALAASQDGEHVYVSNARPPAGASAGAGSLAHFVWDNGATRYRLASLVTTEHVITSLSWVDTDRSGLVAATGAGLEIHALAAETGEATLLGTLPLNAVAVAVSDSHVAVADLESVRLFDLTALTAPRLVGPETPLAGVSALAFSPSGARLLATRFDAGGVRSYAVDASGLTLLGGLDAGAGRPGLGGAESVAFVGEDAAIVAGFCDSTAAVVAVTQGDPSWRAAVTGVEPVQGACETVESEAGTGFIHPVSVAVTAGATGPVIGMMLADRRMFGFERLTWDGTRLTRAPPLPEPTLRFDASHLEFVTAPTPPLAPLDPRERRGLAAITATQGGFVAISGISNSLVRLDDSGNVVGVPVQHGDGGLFGLSCASGVSMSPDGRQLIVAPRCEPALGILNVDAESGGLTPVAGVALDAKTPLDSVGAVKVVTDTLVAAVVTSPAIGDRGWVAVLERDPVAGTLTQTGQVDIPECAGKSSFLVGLVGSPDGRDLYVADFQRQDPSCVHHLHRDGPAAPFTYVGARTDTAIGGVESFDITNDGRFLYAAAYVGRSVAGFERDPKSGVLTPLVHVTRDDLLGAEFVALSPDERFLYATSPVGSNVHAIARDPVTGAMTHLQTVPRSDEAPLGEAAGVTVSSDGARVYVTARLDDALTVFRRGEDGRLAVETVVRGAFDWPNAITEGADPRHLYMAAVKTSTVTVLRVSDDGDDGCGRACSSN